MTITEVRDTGKFSAKGNRILLADTDEGIKTLIAAKDLDLTKAWITAINDSLLFAQDPGAVVEHGGAKA